MLTKQDNQDRTSLSHWFPVVKRLGIAHPQTILLDFGSEPLEILDGKTPDGWEKFTEQLQEAGRQVGFPCFLRTDHFSGKHDWQDTCFVRRGSAMPRHAAQIVYESHCVDVFGQPCRRWAVRELLPTEPIFFAFDGWMPIVPEVRIFARDGDVKDVFFYWPEEAFESQMVSRPDWREKLSRCEKDTLVAVNDDVLEQSKALSSELGGYWSVDWLLACCGRGWILTDMAAGEQSWRPK